LLLLFHRAQRRDLITRNSGISVAAPAAAGTKINGAFAVCRGALMPAIL
jgi:hypothetical protein